ncbi:MAG: hypothetical protein AAGA99_07260 [Actinomycetota bacterium]
MDPHQRQQFDFLLFTAVDRFVERVIQRCAGADAALARLRDDPNGDGVWLDDYLDAVLSEFLLDNTGGACFVLSALEKRPVPELRTDVAPARIGAWLEVTARAAFRELLLRKVDEALEQETRYGRGEVA